MGITAIPWIVVLIFGGVFTVAAVREILRRRAQGPDVNPRDAFDFDETAPSYEEPETSDPSEPAPAHDPDGDSENGTSGDPDDRGKGRDSDPP